MRKTISLVIKTTIRFYLPQYNVAIECQGIQHFKPIEHFGGEEKFNYTKHMDIKKQKLCEDNDVKMLYYSSIKEPLNQNIINDTEILLNEILKHGKVKNYNQFN